MATGEAWAFRPSHPQAWRSGAKAAGSTTRSWAGTATRTRPGKSASLRTDLIGHHPATGQVWAQVVGHPELVDILEWKRDPETGDQSIAPVRVSAPKPKPRRQPGHRPAPAWGGAPVLRRSADCQSGRFPHCRSGRLVEWKTGRLAEFVTFSAVSTWSVSTDIRMCKNAGMVLTHPMVAASSADIPWQCVRQIAKGGCQGRRQNVPLGAVSLFQDWPVQSKIQGPGNWPARRATPRSPNQCGLCRDDGKRKRPKAPPERLTAGFWALRLGFPGVEF